MASWSMSYEGTIFSSVKGERPPWTEGPSPGTWGTASVDVPVVPCDDAAVERAARVLLPLTRGDVDDAQRIAKTVLRAARAAP